MKKYKVTLDKGERERLMNIIQKGSHSTQQYHIAYILLHSDEGEFGNKMTGEDISMFLLVSMRMIDRTKQRFVEDGFEACLERKPMSRTKGKKIDGDTEAHLIALSCSKAPQGFSRWSLRLLADKMVELKYAENISHETIRKALKKTN
jgi:hypothetical protein